MTREELRTRRGFVASGACLIGAILPTFLAGMLGFSPHGITIGIAFIVAVYVLIARSDAYDAFVQNPRVERALRITYYTVVVLTLLFPIGMASTFFIGMVAVALVMPLAAPFDPADPLRTLSITLIYAMLAHLVLIGFGALIYTFTPRLLKRNPVEACAKCGYDLRGSLEFGRCPECGNPIPVEPSPSGVMRD